ncbi:histidine kinase-like ATPase [Xylariomycetidae sp. FL2044]|nr:histidine kinase-like ATPase [Xylariomycetidae sp. FL2044]
MIGSSVITLARNLYSSNARFIFELLQNADDNRYSHAKSHGFRPWVSFRVYPDRVVVECNEDGFTPENIRSICRVGESSKKGAQGYIGEKGIGFKSVFMAAYKAHIQSGDYSFYFQHREGDSGMGMISPVWQDPDNDTPEARAGWRTRITLFLHSSQDPQRNKTRMDNIFKQLKEMRDTFLLFLQNIRSIYVSFHDEQGKRQSQTEYSWKTPVSSANHVCLQTLKDDEEVRQAHYHITRMTAHNLARSENRTYSESEIRRKAYAVSDIVLAFPLTEKDEPVTESQDVFAFLPVRNMGFKFLIQADFVTEASRQDVVTTSERNFGLISSIADAFCRAVEELCNHPTLQYTWMRYLPQEGDYPWDPFWGSLCSQINHKISQTPVLRPRSERGLCRTSQLKMLPAIATDASGDPLFDDIRPEAYLSE